MPKGRRGKTSTTIVLAAREQRKEPTAQEKRLWEALRGRKLDGLKFRRQHPSMQFLLDNFCVEHQLVVEIDGGIHDDPDQRAHDDAMHAGAGGVRDSGAEVSNEEVDGDLRACCSASATISLRPLSEMPRHRAASQERWIRGPRV
jgi:very-short-patch-repair endonuclease